MKNPYLKQNIFVTASVSYHKATYQLPLCLIDTLILFCFGTTAGLAIFRMQVTSVSSVRATAGEGIHWSNMLQLKMLPLQGQLSLHVKLVVTYFTPAIFSHPACSHVLYLHPAAQYLDRARLWKWHAKRRITSDLGMAVVGSPSPSGES